MKTALFTWSGRSTHEKERPRYEEMDGLRVFVWDDGMEDFDFGCLVSLTQDGERYFAYPSEISDVRE